MKNAYCGKKETLEHFIYECVNTNPLLNIINTWWKNAFALSIPISILEAIFGVPNEMIDKYLNLLNYMILYAKYYIYITKKQNKNTNLYEYLLLLKKN